MEGLKTHSCAGLVGLVLERSCNVASSVVGCGSTYACYMVAVSGCVPPPVIYMCIYFLFYFIRSCEVVESSQSTYSLSDRVCSSMHPVR